MPCLLALLAADATRQAQYLAKGVADLVDDPPEVERRARQPVGLASTSTSPASMVATSAP
jgi:hypothetical protein